jgi:hypothetical protein
MKKLLIIAITLMLLTALFAGCGSSPASSSASPSPSSSEINTPPPDTATPEVSPTPTTDDSGSDKAKTYKEWSYYLDGKDSAVVDFNEDPPLHMKKTDGGDDQALGVRGFNFDIIGDYIYIDSISPDTDDNGVRTWSTTRMKPDGSDKKKLEYGGMSARHVKEDEQKFYFTTMGDSAIYVSDYSCDNVSTLIVNLPDVKELDKKLGNDKSLHLDINDVKDGWVDFTATFSTEDGIELYNGTYRITEDGKEIKKTKGTYIDNSQESEAD